MKKRMLPQKTTSRVPVENMIEAEYAHPGTYFENVKQHDKGYIIIHPQFVSEDTSDAKKLWKKHQKFFGESK